MKFKSEKEFEEIALPFFQSKYNLLLQQVPLHNKIIDLAAIDEHEHLIGVEFKLKDWKRALKQVVENLNAFDYMYVCIPGGTYIEKLLSKAKSIGIGVLTYDHDNSSIKCNLEPKRNCIQWKPNVDFVKDYIKSGGKI